MTNEQPNKMWSDCFREPLNRTFEQWQRSFPFDSRLAHMAFVLLCIAGLLNRSAPAQRPTVTIYTPSSVADSLLPGDKRGVFFGSIFDGADFMFLFQGHGFERNQHRFVTIALDPGPHDLSATYTKDGSHGAHVQLTVEPGMHYFLRANSESLGMLVVGTVKPILQQVTCNIAHEEIGLGKPLVPKRISPAIKPRIEANDPIPACP